MNLKEQIIEVEKNYSEQFSLTIQTPYGLRFLDGLLPDMHFHNFIRIPISSLPHMAEILSEEKKFREKHKNEVVQIQIFDCAKSLLEQYIDKEAIVEQLIMYADSNTLATYFDSIPPHFEGQPCSIRFAASTEDFQMGTLLDEESFGTEFADFAKRRYARKQIVYEDCTIPMNNAICFTGRTPIGNCDFYTQGAFAKIEDFDVLEKFQRKGYGTRLMKFLVEYGIEQGAIHFFLQVDSDNSARKMYEKLGFTAITNNLIVTRRLSEFYEGV